jgi:hypothetical protein
MDIDVSEGHSSIVIPPIRIIFGEGDIMKLKGLPMREQASGK